MRIKDIGSRAGDVPISLRGGVHSHDGLGRAQNKTFEDALHDSHQRALKEELTALLADIEEQGERLSRRLTIAELLRYKKLISTFLDKAVSNMYTTLKYNHFDQNGGHSIHHIVKTIDRRLEELTEEVLKQEKDTLAVLGYIDDVKGLLMDIIT